MHLLQRQITQLRERVIGRASKFKKMGYLVTPADLEWTLAFAMSIKDWAMERFSEQICGLGDA